tara:strand:- start:3304 stop:4137 length:834 start_codon:yes stop_codon:yes gene_type:complete
MHNIEHKNGISVVCPTYNSDNYIQRTINSLVDQSIAADEIIFSDDGSDDKTINILKKNELKFTSSNTKLKILINNHKGPGAARNAGILNATYPWIAFLDSDDIWHKQKLEIVKKQINDFPEKNFFIHWEKYVRDRSNSSSLKHGIEYNKNFSLSKQLYKKNFFSTSAVICKKSLLKKVGLFDTTLPNGQDYDLWLKLTPIIKLQIIPEFLGTYIEEKNSITARPYYKRVISEVRIALRHKNKGGIKLFIIKLFKIVFSKQWIYSLFNLIFNQKKHNY